MEDIVARTEERAYVSQDALLKRLKRTEGQVRGIGKMIGATATA